MASQYDVFLSHGSPDKPWVRTLVDALEDSGLTVFLDEQDLHPGQNWVLGLSEALQNSRAFVLVLSQATIDRPWVEAEWTAYMADHGPRQLFVPVILEQADLPTFLKPLQAIYALDRNAERVANQLVRAVKGAGAGQKPVLTPSLTFVVVQADEDLAITGADGTTRQVTPPWRQSLEFGAAWIGYRSLAKEALETDAQRSEIHVHARTLGQGFFEILFHTEDERQRLAQATLAGAHRPLVIIRSDDDFVLSLPWELLWYEDQFLVRDGVVDMVRSTVDEVGFESLPAEPTEPFSLVTNVSAPQGSLLSYEAESYRITRALSENCVQTPTELGTLDDLVNTVAREKPAGIHFSGHGAPGHLVFEDDLGQNDVVSVTDLVTALKQKLPGGKLPAFFYLASCHGNTPASTDTRVSGSESAAAQLHRAGVALVVGYYGPIADELSTRAEEALYRAIASGEPLTFAMRQALNAMRVGFDDPDAAHRPDETDGKGLQDISPSRGEASTAPNRSHPFAWAQLVCYHRGPDRPLGLPVKTADLQQRAAALQRTFTGMGNRRILSTGFIGRRTELHRIRARIRRGDRVFVLQGLGGLGKTPGRTGGQDAGG